MKRSFRICVFQLVFFFFCQLPSAHCQLSKIDSLLTVLKTTKEDTTRIKTYNDLFLEYEFFDEKKAKEYLNKALELSQKNDYKKGLATTYHYLGYLAEDKSNYPEALKYHMTSFKIMVAIGDKKGLADSYSIIGNVYYYQGNYAEAIKNHFNSLKLYEEIDEKPGIGNAYNNIGNIYQYQNNYPEALKKYLASLKIYLAIDYKVNIASGYNNIGVVYYAKGNYPEALQNHLAALKIREAIDDKNGIAVSYNNIGLVYFSLGNYPAALKNCFFSLKMKEAAGNKTGIVSSLNSIGNIYFRQKEYIKAGKYLIKANELAKEIGYKEYLRETYKILAGLDSARGNFKGAYQNHKLFILYYDSLNNEESRKRTIQSQMTFDFEKKEAVSEAEHKKELENQQVIAEEKSRKQKSVILFVVIGLLLVITFAGFIFRSLRVTRRQKNIIEVQKNLVELQKQEVEEQKLLVEEKQREIIDSITYARRIQRAILPSEKYIDKNLKRLKR